MFSLFLRFSDLSFDGSDGLFFLPFFTVTLTFEVKIKKNSDFHSCSITLFSYRALFEYMLRRGR